MHLFICSFIDHISLIWTHEKKSLNKFLSFADSFTENITMKSYIKLQTHVSTANPSMSEKLLKRSPKKIQNNNMTFLNEQTTMNWQNILIRNIILQKIWFWKSWKSVSKHLRRCSSNKICRFVIPAQKKIIKKYGGREDVVL